MWASVVVGLVLACSIHAAPVRPTGPVPVLRSREENFLLEQLHKLDGPNNNAGGWGWGEARRRSFIEDHLFGKDAQGLDRELNSLHTQFKLLKAQDGPTVWSSNGGAHQRGEQPKDTKNVNRWVQRIEHALDDAHVSVRRNMADTRMKEVITTAAEALLKYEQRQQTNTKGLKVVTVNDPSMPKFFGKAPTTTQWALANEPKPSKPSYDPHRNPLIGEHRIAYTRPIGQRKMPGPLHQFMDSIPKATPREVRMHLMSARVAQEQARVQMEILKHLAAAQGNKGPSPPNSAGK